MATCPQCAAFYHNANACVRDGVLLIDDEVARKRGITPLAAERYEILSLLGEGGMGSVYLALHRDLGRKVALKVLRTEDRQSQALERFKREARASSLINHRHVVSILDFGELPDGSAYYVMEYLEGKSLADAIDKEGPFSLERTLGIAIQIARGIAAAHEKGVVHRDLKPDNVFLLENQELPDFVKILDFGIAKLSDGDKITKTGMVLGTPDYMAPEQAMGQPADHRCDIYSLGILCYEMLVGVRPFLGDSFMQVLSQHLYAPPPLVRENRTDIEIPEEYDGLIQRALAKQADARFQTMGEFLEALYALPNVQDVLPQALLPKSTGRQTALPVQRAGAFQTPRRPSTPGSRQLSAQRGGAGAWGRSGSQGLPWGSKTGAAMGRQETGEASLPTAPSSPSGRAITAPPATVDLPPSSAQDEHEDQPTSAWADASALKEWLSPPATRLIPLEGGESNPFEEDEPFSGEETSPAMASLRLPGAPMKGPPASRASGRFRPTRDTGDTTLAEGVKTPPSLKARSKGALLDKDGFGDSMDPTPVGRRQPPGRVVARIDDVAATLADGRLSTSDLPTVPPPTEVGIKPQPTEVGIYPPPTEVGIKPQPTEVGIDPQPTEVGIKPSAPSGGQRSRAAALRSGDATLADGALSAQDSLPTRTNALITTEVEGRPSPVASLQVSDDPYDTAVTLDADKPIKPVLEEGSPESSLPGLSRRISALAEPAFSEPSPAPRKLPRGLIFAGASAVLLLVVGVTLYFVVFS